LELIIPYQSASPWTPCELVTTASSPTANVLIQTGDLSFNVLNPLTASDGLVSSSIEIQIYVRGGPDIEFEVPGAIWETAISEWTPTAGPIGPSMSKEEEKEEIVPEGRSVFQSDCTEEVVPVLLFDAYPPSKVTMMSCFGEKITNLRSLTRRFGPMETVTVDFNTTYLEEYYGFIFARVPLAMLVARAFAYCAGGTRAEFRTNNVTTVSQTYMCNLSWGYPDCGCAGMPGVIWDTETPGLVFDVPYVHPTPFFAIGEVLKFAPATSTKYNKPTYGGPIASLKIDTASTAAASFYRSFAMADDFTCGWQIGIPAIKKSGTITMQYPKLNESWTDS
jgi:hypothetical protein